MGGKSRNTSALVLLSLVLIILVVSAGAYYKRAWEIVNFDELVLNDFKGIYTGSILIAERQNPYDYELTRQLVSCTNCPYQLPPFLAATLSLLINLTAQQVQLVWVLLNQVALIVMLVFAIKLARPQIPPWVALLATALVFGFYPIYTDLQLGNVSVLLGCLVTLTAWFWQRDRRILAGFCLGLGIVIKFVPGLLLVYFLWKREYRIVLYSVLFALILLVLPDLLMRTQYLQTYFLTFTDVIDRWTFGSPSHIDNQSLHGALSRFYVLLTRKEVIPSFVRLFFVRRHRHDGHRHSVKPSPFQQADRPTDRAPICAVPISFPLRQFE